MNVLTNSPIEHNIPLAKTSIRYKPEPLLGRKPYLPPYAWFYLPKSLSDQRFIVLFQDNSFDFGGHRRASKGC
ncbi:hypothetical protein Cflav_PD5565 [Pedosphaera parvula Ellin514]|uniref:Uncharacterized protein n=1 Tax=Pedosphaera parvula (strain Ellin514) TaxID=320771 RepID=B9XBP5_PEDPL|nr:hypothetical protein Cflav_PD5565 [Pedosphaera parvula Ellin514]